MFWCKNVNPHIVCLLARVPPVPPALRLRLDLSTGPPPPLLGVTGTPARVTESRVRACTCVRPVDVESAGVLAGVRRRPEGT